MFGTPLSQVTGSKVSSKMNTIQYIGLAIGIGLAAYGTYVLIKNACDAIEKKMNHKLNDDGSVRKK
jgi:hypothetical protein